MKVTIAPQALLDGLNIASAAAASRTPKPALQCVLITALKDTVLLMATDLESGIRYTLTEVQVDQEGQALVAVGKFTQIIRESVDETITLHLEGNQLQISGSDSQFRMVSGDPKDFPPVPTLEGKPDFEMTGQQLRTVIDRTLFAAARESTRYAIDGLLWDREGERLKVVGTDGRRLAVAALTIEKAASNSAKVIVPSKAMALFGRMIVDPEERFGVKFLSNQILIAGSHVTVSSVLLEGHFPKYEDVIPQDCDRLVEAGVAEMLSAVRRAALLTSEDSKGIRMSFDNNRVLMSGRVPEQGESSVELPVSYEGDQLEIGFNPGFVVDVLKVIDSDRLQFWLKDSNRPALFRYGEDYTYVVMPVNLS